MNTGGDVPNEVTERKPDPPFWSDDFDMDLPKIVPDARAALGDLGDLELVTHGHSADGRLNHPSVWNGYGGMLAFFGRTSPMKPEAFWTNEPLVRCTLWEAIRDVWVHDYVLNFECTPVWSYPNMNRAHFYPLMAHVRGWARLSDAEVTEHRVAVLDAIVETAEAIRGAIERTNPR